MQSTEATILNILEEDYRAPLLQIARSIGVSRSTVRRRITQLFRSKAFDGYQVEVNGFALGLERLAYLEVKTNPREAWLLRAIESLDQCIQSDGVIGEYGLVFKMLFRNAQELADRLHILDSLIASSAAKRYRLIDVIESYKERGFVTRPHHQREVDALDLALLRILMDQRTACPLPLWRLSQRLEAESEIGATRSTIQKRIRRMYDDGIIRQFTIRPRSWLRGGSIRAYVRLKTDPGQTRRMAIDVLAKMPEIVSLHRTGEDYGLFSEVFVKDLDWLDGFLKATYEVEGLIDTMTTIVVEKRKHSPMPIRSLLPCALGDDRMLPASRSI